MFRRGSADRDDALPSRDEVAGELAAADERAAGAERGEGPERLEVVSFLPRLRAALLRVVPALLIVGVLLVVPYTSMTELGRAQVVSDGFLPVAAAWLGMIVLITLGAALGLLLSRALSSGARRVRRVEVLSLAIADAVFAAAGATFVTVLVAGGFNDLLRMLAFSFVLTFLFTWAMLLPLYRAAWDAAAERSGLSAD